MKQFCVLVTSSDSRKDIFDTCFPHSERIWEDCDWPRYAGFTTRQPNQYGFHMLVSGNVGEWRESVAAHIDALPAEIKYILLMVEDTLFMQPVDMIKLGWIANNIKRANLSYTRLVPRRWHFLNVPMILGELECIPFDDPYYNSIEMAVWERSYLRQQLDLPGDAWAFEHHVSIRDHWAVKEPVFDQHQIVQKGRWNRDAPRLLRRAGLPPPRPGRPYQSIGARYRGHWQNLNFALFGWTSFRVKRWLRSRLPV